MTYIVYFFTFLHSWFVGPLPTLQLSPDSPPIYYIGPSLVLPQEPTADGSDRLVVMVNPGGPTRPPGEHRQRYGDR